MKDTNITQLIRQVSPFGRNRPILRGLRSRLGKTALIYPASALNAIALGTVNLGIVFYLRDVFEATATQVGLISALFSVSYFVGCFVLRPFSRLLLPRYSLVLSTGMNAVFIAGILLSGRVGFVAMFQVLYGFGVALFWPPIMGWLSTGLEGRHLGKTLSRFNLSWSVGMILSPFLAGALTELDPRFPLVLGSAVFLLITLGVLAATALIHPIRTDRYRETPFNEQTTGPDTSTPLRFPSWVGVVATYFTVGVVSVIFPLYAREQLLLSASAVGAILLLRAVAMTSGFLVLGAHTGWHFKRAPILLAQTGLGGCLLALVLGGGITSHLVVIPVIGLLTALVYSQSVFHGASGAHERARRMAIHESLLVSGSVLGSATGGALFERFSITGVYLVATVLLVVAAGVQSILFLLQYRRTVRQK